MRIPPRALASPLLLLSLATGCAHANAPAGGAQAKQPTERSAGSEPARPFDMETNEIYLMANLALTAYQKVISPQDRPSCIYQPSCSAYMRRAISDRGMGGLFMGFDRLLRCNAANAAASDMYDRHEGLFLIDPVPPRKNEPDP